MLIQNSKARIMINALQKAGLISVEVTPRRDAYPVYTFVKAATG